MALRCVQVDLNEWRQYMQEQKTAKRDKFPAMLKYLENEIAPLSYEPVETPPSSPVTSKQALLEGWLDLLKDEAYVLDTPGSMKLGKDRLAQFQEAFQRLRATVAVRLVAAKVATWHRLRLNWEVSVLDDEREEDLVAQMEAMRQYAAIRMMDQAPRSLASRPCVPCLACAS